MEMNRRQQPAASGSPPEKIVKESVGEYHMPEVFYADDFKIKVKGNGIIPLITSSTVWGSTRWTAER